MSGMTAALVNQFEMVSTLVHPEVAIARLAELLEHCTKHGGLLATQVDAAH